MRFKNKKIGFRKSVLTKKNDVLIIKAMFKNLKTTFKEEAHALGLEACRLDLRTKCTIVPVAMHESLKMKKASSCPSESPHSKQVSS